MLVESEKREMGGDVACLDLAPVPEGRQRGKFLAVGMYDGTVRVLSLEPDSTLKMLGTQVGGYSGGGGVLWLARCLAACVNVEGVPSAFWWQAFVAHSLVCSLASSLLCAGCGRKPRERAAARLPQRRRRRQQRGRWR